MPGIAHVADHAAGLRLTLGPGAAADRDIVSLLLRRLLDAGPPH